MEVREHLGTRVVVGIRRLEAAIANFIREAGVMRRTRHRDTVQLSSSAQKLQDAAFGVVNSELDLQELFREVHVVEIAARRIEKIEADIAAAKAIMFRELADNEQRERKLRASISRVRASEAATLSRELANDDELITADNPAPRVNLTRLLQYAKRIGRSTSLQHGQPPTLFPDAEEMKDSILHTPLSFAVKRKAVDTDKGTPHKKANQTDVADDAAAAKPSDTDARAPVRLIDLLCDLLSVRTRKHLALGSVFA